MYIYIRIQYNTYFIIVIRSASIKRKLNISSREEKKGGPVQRRSSKFVFNGRKRESERTTVIVFVRLTAKWFIRPSFPRENYIRETFRTRLENFSFISTILVKKKTMYVCARRDEKGDEKKGAASLRSIQSSLNARQRWLLLISSSHVWVWVGNTWVCLRNCKGTYTASTKLLVKWGAGMDL